MTQPTDTSTLAGDGRASGLRARLFAPTALQKMLAFASLLPHNQINLNASARAIVAQPPQVGSLYRASAWQFDLAPLSV